MPKDPKTSTQMPFMPADPMADLVSKYGTDSVLEGLQEPEQSPPQKASEPPVSDSRQPTTEPAQKPSVEESEAEESTLDSATLQALGLIPEDEEPPPGDNADDDGTTQSNIDPTMLAKALGLQTEDLVIDANGVQVRTKIDGEPGLVSMQDLRKGYQKDRSLTQRNEVFLQQKQEWENARQQADQQSQQMVAMATEYLNAEDAALDQQYTRDWNQLRQDDPAEYAAQVAEYNQRKQQIAQRKQQLEQKVKETQQQRQQEQFKQIAELQKQGRKVVAEALSWKTEKEYEAGAKKLFEYLHTQRGVTPEQISMVTDPYLFIDAEKARRYDDLMAKVKATRKQVAKTGKVPRDTASRPAGSNKRQNLQQSMGQLYKTGTVEDAGEVFKRIGLDKI